MHDDRAARDHVDRALIRRFQATRDPVLLERVVVRTRPLANHLARGYADRGEPIGDLRQVAMLGLVQAIERYDPASGNRFTSFAVPTITGALKRYFRDVSWRVHVPRRLQELNQRARHEGRLIETRTGRSATRGELAAALGASGAELDELDGLSSALAPVALDAGGDDEHAGVALGRSDPGFGRIEDGDAVRDAATTLADRDRTILWLRYVEDRRQHEIGEIVGVSQVQVSRLLKQAVERMREHVVED